ncbi:MAG: hypothetical protein U1F56_13120 [Rubrivivax sp.]
MKPADERPQDEFNRLVTQMASTRVETRTPRPAVGALRQVLQRVAAALRFDSTAAAPAATGLRGNHAEVRHLLFSAKGRDIDLRVSPSGGSYALTGQVLGPDEGGRVALAAHLRAGSPPPPPTRHTRIDPLGEFHLDAIDEGTYVLTLQLGGDEIVLPPIDVRDDH